MLHVLTHSFPTRRSSDLGITRSADVFATAVSSIDDDSARVLVAGAFTDSYRQGEGDEAQAVDQEPLPFRFTVDLVVIEGEWLVDDFSPVSSGEIGRAHV